MKKLLVFFFVLIAVVSQAQTTRYDTCSSIGQFAGTWVNINGPDTIRIILKYYRSWSPALNSISDDLIGWQELKRGTHVVQSDMANTMMNLPYNYDDIADQSFSILLGPIKCDSLVLGGSLNDLLRSRERKTVTVTINSSGTQMFWHQDHSEGYGWFTGAYGMTLPRDFILTKQ